MLDEVKIIELKQNIFNENQVNGDIIRTQLRDEGILMINIMSSPGSGKTTTLCRTIEMLKDKVRVGVLECDIDASCDAQTILATGSKAVQLHTGGMCHMDAGMTKQGLDEIDTSDLDLIFIENVGNLVCPAEYDTGSHLNVAILSIPEGDDKPVKYPLMFEVCDVVLINKIDALAVFDFDVEKAKKEILKHNPNAQIYCISSKNGVGFDNWIDYLNKQLTLIKE